MEAARAEWQDAFGVGCVNGAATPPTKVTFVRETDKLVLAALFLRLSSTWNSLTAAIPSPIAAAELFSCHSRPPAIQSSSLSLDLFTKTEA
jgi:hypothetical protein